MLSIYEILKASKTGITPDMWTALAGMNLIGKGSGHEVKELTGIPPLSFTADGTPLLDYLISGNMSQVGVPTPDSPIQPSECGELEISGVKAGQYKIPISSAGQTNNIYLGEVPTTRKIKKLVFDGTENWGSAAASGGRNRFILTTNNAKNADTANPFSMCTHLPLGANGATYNTDDVYTIASERLYIRLTVDYNSLADFKSYLATQYAAGTPVTVWYVLAQPETGIVNEPLRKIDNYADTVSYEQAGVQIPTNRGNTVIDVETTLKPSEMYIKYRE